MHEANGAQVGSSTDDLASSAGHEVRGRTVVIVLFAAAAFTTGLVWVLLG